MQMQPPGPAHEKIARIAGEWKGEETMAPSPWDPEGGTAEARVTNRVAIDGFIVVQDYEQIRNGKTTFRGHGVFSYDNEQGHYVLHWWDSMGMAPNVFIGSFDGDTCAMTSTSPMGHTRATFVLGEDTYDFKMEMSMDGSNWNLLMNGTYSR